MSTMNRAMQTLDAPPTAQPASAAFVDPFLGDGLLTVNDAARFLHVTVSWVYEHTRDDAEDRLPFVKLGKYVRFDRTDLREFINAKRQAARNAARRR
jgi:excisionase family DNA binding protein